MVTRKSTGKKLRFEVFKRDSFTCQYCGAKAPESILHCDHIKPVADGGTTDILNLITACANCNGGKGAGILSEHAVLTKQHAQASDLQARRSQIEMMAAWQSEISKLDDYSLLMAQEAWFQHINGQTSLTETGRALLSKWLKKNGLQAIYKGMEGATSSYLQIDADGKFTFDSIAHAFSMIPRVIAVQKKAADKPYLQRMYYARGILRNRLHYVDERSVLQLMEDAVAHGADIEKIVDLAKDVRNWTQFRDIILSHIESSSKESEESGRGENS